MEIPNKNEKFIESTLQKVYVLEHELAMEKLKTSRLHDTVRDIIRHEKIPEDSVKWYKFFGGNSMKGGFDATLKRERIDAQGTLPPTAEADMHDMIEYANTHPFTEINVYLPASYAHAEAMTPTELHMYRDFGPNNPSYRAEFFYEMSLPTIQFDVVLYVPVLLQMDNGSYLELPEKTNLYVHIMKTRSGMIVNELIVDVDMSGRPSVGGRRYRKHRFGGSREEPSTPMVSLPGASPSSSPSLRRTDGEGDYIGMPPVPRRLDFSTVSEDVNCAPISKRLPGHAADQCENVPESSLTYEDILACEQVSPCGPVRRRGGKHRKTRKSKKKNKRTTRKV